MPWPPARSPALDALVARAVNGVIRDFSSQGLQTNEIAVTLVDLSDSAHPVWASHRGEDLIYPASVVKLFYLVAAHQWMEDGRLEDSPNCGGRCGT